MYSLTNIVSATKSRIRWTERVARKAQKESTCRGLLRKREERDHLEDLGVDGRTQLKLILNN